MSAFVVPAHAGTHTALVGGAGLGRSADGRWGDDSVLRRWGGAGFGPQNKSGATESSLGDGSWVWGLGAGVGAGGLQSAFVEGMRRWCWLRRDTRGKRGYDGILGRVRRCGERGRDGRRPLGADSRSGAGMTRKGGGNDGIFWGGCDGMGARVWRSGRGCGGEVGYGGGAGHGEIPAASAGMTVWGRGCDGVGSAGVTE